MSFDAYGLLLLGLLIVSGVAAAYVVSRPQQFSDTGSDS